MFIIFFILTVKMKIRNNLLALNKQQQQNKIKSNCLKNKYYLLTPDQTSYCLFSNAIFIFLKTKKKNRKKKQE